MTNHIRITDEGSSPVACRKSICDIARKLLLLIFIMLYGCSDERTLEQLTVTSLAVEDNSLLPGKHTCYGSSISPPFTIEHVPEEAAELVLVIRNEDLGSVNWVLWGISVGSGAVMADIPGGRANWSNYKQGLADDGTIGYSAVCPDENEINTYKVEVWALDEALPAELAGNVDYALLKDSIENAVLGKGTMRFEYF